MCHVESGHTVTIESFGADFFFFLGQFFTNMTSIRLNDANYINLLRQTNERKSRVVLRNEAFPK